MSVSDNRLEELKHAYQVIGVPLHSSAQTIKQSYRQLVKRWHPDLYISNLSAHLEATQMSKLINEAYSTISRAPLRYYVETHSTPPARRYSSNATVAESKTAKPTMENLDTARLEFWIRLVVGAVNGAVFCLVVIGGILEIWDEPSTELPVNLSVLALIGLVIIVGSAIVNARFGDKFWHSILKRWWVWR
jgi:DnaJ domain